jgi:ABC-type multidrug transport system ATPase subunit
MINPYTSFECKNLDLCLGDKELFSLFNFKFEGPGIVMIEGENGSGKSSLLKTFAGFISPANSDISFSGKKSSDIGTADFSFFTTTSLGLLIDLTGAEHIEIISRALKLDQIYVQNEIEKFKEISIFAEVLKKPVGEYSQGMKQILRLFLHFFFDPKVIFLDEPFLYLSPFTKDFFKLKIEKKSQNCLIFITDQKFDWIPQTKHEKIQLSLK